MIIKETPWEKRNLGVSSSAEFYVGKDEVLDSDNVIRNTQFEYQVLHIESGNSKALILAQDNGFRLIEMNIQLTRDLDTVEIPFIYKRYESVLDFRYADHTEIESILSTVADGKMFLTDKVALDPFFSTKKAGERYAKWGRDVINSGGITVIATYKGKPIGFEIYQEREQKCINFIGGIYPEFENKGLGFAPLYAELLSQRERGNKSVQTGVSSNNLPVIRVHEMLGFKINSLSYSLIKHIGGVCDGIVR